MSRRGRGSGADTQFTPRGEPAADGARTMSNNSYDNTFLKHFAQIIAGLMLVTVVLMGLAYSIYASRDPYTNPRREAEVAARIAPEGSAYAGSTGKAAMEAAAEAAKKAAAGQVAYEGTTDGSVIFGKLCTACHGTGAGGAPKLEKALWADRVKQGVDVLVKHAVEGFKGNAGLMPPKGGNPSLTDEQVQATVKWMLANIK
jgi:cytochrome c5